MRCPNCGYCASDLSTVHEKVLGLVGSEAYQRILADPGLPEAARKFVCHARILEAAGQLADAGWVALQGAWVCDDDEEDRAEARRTDGEPGAAGEFCRDLAIQFWVRGKRAGEPFADRAEEFALLADVLRRAGRFDEALLTCNQGLAEDNLPEVVDHILRFEKTRIQARDRGRYSLAEIPALQT